MSSRRCLRLGVAIGALSMTACAAPTVESDGPSPEPAPSSTELFDIAERDPLPFPGYDVTRVTIAPLPGVDPLAEPEAPVPGESLFYAPSHSVLRFYGGWRYPNGHVVTTLISRARQERFEFFIKHLKGS